jgi:mannosyl-oligosaccharide alpha-1,2-mannosidase
MLKLWLQSGKNEPKYRDAYDEAIEGLHNLLLRYSSPNNLAYLVKLEDRRTIHEFEHLECFMGGKSKLLI